MPRIKVNGKEYRVNNPPRADVMNMMDEKWKARMMGLSFEDYQEINKQISLGAKVKILR